MHRDKRGGNILIVDDTLDNLRLLSQMLTAGGHSVRAAKSGREALASIQAAKPDMVLLDIKLPDLSGYEVCTLLKADVATRDVPIMFLSSLDEIKDKLHGFEVGGIDYVTKPFHEQEVLARVQTQVNLSHLRTELKRHTEDLELSNERLTIEIAERRRVEQEREKLIEELQSALENIRTLDGLVPICSSCKKIRDDKGFWNQLEKYLVEHTDAKLTHGICPDCAELYFPGIAQKTSPGGAL
ncbi:MAG: response regulator [Ignavibacteriales bacterium]|nr:response regulator [Ignavibacteriales bacterium]